MAARPIATLTVSFGLVSIPVKLFSATEASRAISFNLLHKACGSRLKQQYVCVKEDVIVPRDDMVKGYEFEKDQYVQFTPEELKLLEEAVSCIVQRRGPVLTRVASHAHDGDRGSVARESRCGSERPEGALGPVEADDDSLGLPSHGRMMSPVETLSVRDRTIPIAGNYRIARRGRRGPARTPCVRAGYVSARSGRRGVPSA